MDRCKVCNGETQSIFEKKILKKYDASYHQCKTCEFVQTSEPAWIEEAYNSAITSLDIGLLKRNIALRDIVPRIIDACFPKSKLFIDYAGGYGAFTRLMRDEGFNFYRQDPFCENLFANYFDVTDIPDKSFDVLTAFEVFEHFVRPAEEIEKIFGISDNIIFSTELYPADPAQFREWWYLSTETGQHVAFYSQRTMEFIARKHNKNYYQKGTAIHMFTSQKLSSSQVAYAFEDQEYKSYLKGLVKRPYNFRIDRPSLTEQDYLYIKTKL